MRDSLKKLLLISKFINKNLYSRFIYIFIIIIISSITEIYFLSNISHFLNKVINDGSLHGSINSFDSIISYSYGKIFDLFNRDINYILANTLTIILISIFSLFIKLFSTRVILFESAYIASYFEIKSAKIIENMNYEKSKKLNSSDILTYFNHIPKFSNAILEASFQALSSLFLAISISLYLIIFTGNTLIMPLIVVIIFYLFILKKNTKILKRLSDNAEELSKKRTSIINYKVLMFRNLKLNRFNKYFNKFNLEGIIIPLNNIAALGGYIAKLPRIIIEYLLIILLISILFMEGEDISLSISKLGAILFALLRITPSIQQIYLFLNNLNKEKYAINSLFQLLSYSSYQDKENEGGKNIAFPIKKIILDSISFSYGFKNKPLISDFSYTFQAGNSYAICGESGTGKSTILDIILCLLNPIKGNIYLNDRYKKSPNYITKIIHSNSLLVGQNDFYCGSYVWEILEIDKNYKFQDEIKLKLNKGAEILDIKGFLGENFLEKFIGENGSLLSGGQLQRLVLLKAYISDKQLLIFDEVTSALDEYNEKIIIDMFCNNKEFNKGRIVIFSTHSKNLANACDSIITIKQ